MADFQQFYGIAIPLDDLPEFDLLRYSILYGQLPAESRTARRQNPDLVWGATEYLLRRIEFNLRSLIWGMSNDAKRKVNEPKPIKTPAEIARNKQHKDAALANKREIDRILGMEVNNG